MRTRTTALALAGALAVTLTGCGESSEADTETIELRMLVNVTPNLTNEFWNDLVAPFEDAHPGIDVVIQDPGAEGVVAALPRLLASGDAPDILQSMPPNPDLADELVDLSGYEWAAGGPLADQYSIDGNYYMAGIGLQLQSLMFYNKTAFSEAGISELPTTVEEFDEALAALLAAGWTPVQTGGDWMSSHALQALALPTIVAEDPQWYANMSSGETTFSQTYGPFVARYAQWVEAGYIPTDALGIQYPDAEQAFLAGQTAVYPMGSWFAGSFAQADDPADIGVFAGPAVAGVDQAAMGANIASPYSILRNTEHLEAAADLLEYLTTDEEAVIAQLRVDGNFREGYEYETTPLGDEIFEIVAQIPAESYTPTGEGYGERRLPAGFSEEINVQTQALMGGAAPEDVIEQMDAWFEGNVR